MPPGCPSASRYGYSELQGLDFWKKLAQFKDGQHSGMLHLWSELLSLYRTNALCREEAVGSDERRVNSIESEGTGCTLTPQPSWINCFFQDCSLLKTNPLSMLHGPCSVMWWERKSGAGGRGLLPSWRDFFPYFPNQHQARIWLSVPTHPLLLSTNYICLLFCLANWFLLSLWPLEYRLHERLDHLSFSWSYPHRCIRYYGFYV